MKGKKKLILIIFLVILFVFLAIFLIRLGLRIEKESTPKALVNELLDNIYVKVSDFFTIDFNEQNEFNFKENVSIKNSLNNDFNLNANYSFLRTLVEKVDEKNYSIDLDFNTNKKQALLKFSEVTNQGEVTGKYLIQNTTQYYAINNFLNSYINDGANNYFENDISKESIKNNLDYLEKFIFKSLQKNLKDGYFKKYEDTININNKKKKVYKILLKIDNKLLKKIEKDIYKDIENNEQALQIFESLSQEKSYFLPLKDNQSITFNFYFDRWLEDFEKLEIINLVGNEEGRIIYEKGSNLIYVNSNEKIDFLIKKDKKNIDILDLDDKKIGSIDIEKNEDNRYINFYMNDGRNNLEFIYQNKHTDLNNKNKLISLKLSVDRKDIIDFSLNSTSSYGEVEEINEDLSNSKLKSSLTKEEEDKLANFKDSIFLKMIGW